MLNEHMSYIVAKSSETGVPPDVLQNLWEKCKANQKEETPALKPSDPLFTKKLMDKFDKQVDTIHLEKARSIVMSRESKIRHGQDWLNSIAENNYIKAKEIFPKFVNSTYESMVNTKSQEFLAKFSEKLKQKDNE